MLKQTDADRLLALEKTVVAPPPIRFPHPGTALTVKVESTDGREKFLIDANRRGKIKLSKCTYNERYVVVEMLLRLDVGGPPHVNPDGEDVPCPHLHIYREGYGHKWAIPIPVDFRDPADLVKTYVDFIRYCKVGNIPDIQRSIE